MVKFMSLSSGSCGNCYYLGNGTNGIIIDAGVSMRRLKKVLQEYDLDFNSFRLFLSHMTIWTISGISGLSVRDFQSLYIQRRRYMMLWHDIRLLLLPSDHVAVFWKKISGRKSLV